MGSPRSLRNALAAPIILTLGAAGWTGAAHAEICSPLRIESMDPVNERVIMEGSRPAAISFHLRATVKNTNCTEVYLGNNRTATSLTVYDTDNKAKLAENHAMGTHLPPGGSQRLISGKIVVKRKDNATPMTTTFKGTVANFQCEGKIDKFVSASDFKYDLTPILRGAKAKRLSGRVRGPSFFKNSQGRTAPPVAVPCSRVVCEVQPRRSFPSDGRVVSQLPPEL